MSKSKNNREISFDKFVKDIEERENSRKIKQEQYLKDHKDSPSRKINKLYRELWQNRIRWTRKK